MKEGCQPHQAHLEIKETVHFNILLKQVGALRETHLLSRDLEVVFIVSSPGLTTSHLCAAPGAHLASTILKLAQKSWNDLASC